MPRLIRRTFRLMAALFGVLALVLVIVSWRVATLPSTSADATPYIKSALSLLAPSLEADIGPSTLSWDPDKQLLTFQCEKAALLAQDKKPVVELEKLSVSQRLWDIFKGRLLPRSFKVEKASYWVQQQPKTEDEPSTTKPKPSGEVVILNTFEFLLLQFIGDEIGNERLTHELELKNISLHFPEQTITFQQISLDHIKKNADGSMLIDILHDGQSSQFHTAYTYDFTKKLHVLALTFKDIRLPAIAADHDSLMVLRGLDFPISGHISLSTDRNTHIFEANAKLQSQGGFIREPQLWDEPRSLKEIVVEGTYNQESGKIAVPIARIDFGGPKLSFKLDAKAPPPKDMVWLQNRLTSNNFTLRIDLDDLPMDQFGAVWPKSIIPDARKWIVESMSKGTFTHGDVTIHGRARMDDLENVVLESGGGSITAKDAQLYYLEGMPIIEKVNANATFDLNHMDVHIESGNTGAVKIKPFTLVIDHFQDDTQYINIPIALQGPTNEVLTILDSPRLGYAKEIGLDPKDSEGFVDGILTLYMPLLDSLLLKDVEVKAIATIKGFGSQNLIPQIALSQGDFTLDLTKTGFNLRGNARLNDVDSLIVWKSSFTANETLGIPYHDGTITATLNGNEWERFYGLDELAQVEGPTPVTIKYKNPRDGFSQIDGQISLKQASVRLKDIGWNKPVGENARVNFLLDIPAGENMVFQNIEIQGPATVVKGTAELDEKTGSLVDLDLSPFVLGRNNAKISYSKPVDASQPLAIKVEGTAFDMFGLPASTKEKVELTPALNEESKALPKKKPKKAQEKPAPNRPKAYTVKLGKLYTGENSFLTDVSGKAKRDTIGWHEVDFKGKAQGTNLVQIKLKPEKGRWTFFASSDDFGVALQGLGLSEGVKGGAIEVNGHSAKDNPRAIEGKVKISSFVVSDLPVLARLLSAVSPFGFMDLITGDANFDKLYGRYRWSGDEIDFKNVRVAGSVVGINLNGKVDAGTHQADLSGTMVPFSFMNSIIGSIPLLGDVITGGSGQGIIATSFSVKGDLSEPDISVNPVSMLAPGFLRNIFFPSEDTSDEDEEGDTEKPEAKTEASPYPVKK